LIGDRGGVFDGADIYTVRELRLGNSDVRYCEKRKAFLVDLFDEVCLGDRFGWRDVQLLRAVKGRECLVGLDDCGSVGRLYSALEEDLACGRDLQLAFVERVACLDAAVSDAFAVFKEGEADVDRKVRRAVFNVVPGACEGCRAGGTGRYAVRIIAVVIAADTKFA